MTNWLYAAFWLSIPVTFCPIGTSEEQGTIALARAVRESLRSQYAGIRLSDAEAQQVLVRGSVVLGGRRTPVNDLVHPPHSREVLALSTPHLDLSPYDELIPSRRTHVENDQSIDRTARLLTQLNLGAMADAFAEVALHAAEEGVSHEAYLYELARLETEQRTQRRTARLVRASGLPPLENLPYALAPPTLSQPAITLGMPQKRILLGDGDQHHRHRQTRGGQKSLSGSGGVCGDRGGLPRALDTHQYAGPATAGGEAGFAAAARAREIGQVRVRHSRRYRLRAAGS